MEMKIEQDSLALNAGAMASDGTKLNWSTVRRVPAALYFGLVAQLDIQDATNENFSRAGDKARLRFVYFGKCEKGKHLESPLREINNSVERVTDTFPE